MHSHAELGNENTQWVKALIPSFPCSAWERIYGCATAQIPTQSMGTSGLINFHKAIVIVLLLFALSATTAHAAKYAVHEDVVYGQGYRAEERNSTPTLAPLLADIYQPKPKMEGGYPAIVIVHGGSFKEGDKQDKKIFILAKNLAKLGYVCVSINYRLIQDYPPSPDPHDITILSAAIHAASVDTKLALRFVAKNAATYNVDPGRIAVLGESAGAFAAIAAGVTDDDHFMNDGPGYPVPAKNYPTLSVRPMAIIDCWGNASLVQKYIDGNDPPMLILHGTKDRELGASFLFGKLLAERCKMVGLRHSFIPLEGERHGAFDAKVDGKKLHELVDGFLKGL